jgi:lysophospholipase L1-like esterase
VALLLVASASASLAGRDDGGLIASMDELRYQSPAGKGEATLVPGKVGKAVHFHFDKGGQGAFFTTNLRGTPEWDKAEGFSFWVKGDGTDGTGGLEFIYDDDYAVRYDLAFPVKGTEWNKVTVAWSDLVPVLPGPRAKPLGTKDGNLPSSLTGPWFGKWWYWGDYPPIGFAVDEVRLENSIARGNHVVAPAGDPLARVRAKLKAGKPVTIVTMGDSLTDKRHWANREVAWVDRLATRLREAHGSQATIVNPAIGGTQLRQNVILVPTWIGRAPEPDLVTIFFGGNDWDAGMRGDEFRRACEDAVDRVRVATQGKADILILTTNPTADRWTETDELAEACREAAREKKAGLGDTARAFHDAGRDDRAKLYVDDRVHLSRSGHELVADTVMKAIGGSDSSR